MEEHKKCKKPRQESGVSDISYARYAGKVLTQNHKALFGDAVLVFLWGHKYGRRKPTETLVFEFCYKHVNSSLEELIKIKEIFILKEEMFR